MQIYVDPIIPILSNTNQVILTWNKFSHKPAYSQPITSAFCRLRKIFGFRAWLHKNKEVAVAKNPFGSSTSKSLASPRRHLLDRYLLCGCNKPPEAIGARNRHQSPAWGLSLSTSTYWKKVMKDAIFDSLHGHSLLSIVFPGILVGMKKVRERRRFWIDTLDKWRYQLAKGHQKWRFMV